METFGLYLMAMLGEIHGMIRSGIRGHSTLDLVLDGDGEIIGAGTLGAGEADSTIHSGVLRFGAETTGEVDLCMWLVTDIGAEVL